MTEYGVTDIWTYVVGAIAIILLPGPNSLYVLATATQRGIKAGYQGACGIFLGDSVLMLLTALGAAGLMHTYPFLFMVVKYAGGAYLAWLGLGLIRSAARNWSTSTPASGTSPHNLSPVSEADTTATATENAHAHAPIVWWNIKHPFMRAFTISIVNPKAIIFLLSFFSQFVDPSYPNPAVPFLILSAIIQLGSVIYLSALIYSGTALTSTFRQRKRLSALLGGGVGTLFIAFGIKLALSRLG